MKIENLSKGKHAARVQTEFATGITTAAVQSFERYLGTAGGAMHVPACVQEAVDTAVRSLTCRLTEDDARYVRGTKIEVIGRGNATHPVCSIECVVTYPQR